MNRENIAMWKNWMQPSKGLGTAWQFAKINSHSFFEYICANIQTILSTLDKSIHDLKNRLVFACTYVLKKNIYVFLSWQILNKGLP